VVDEVVQRLEQAAVVAAAEGMIWRDAPHWQARWTRLDQEAGTGIFGHCFLARLADGSDPTPRIVKVLKTPEAAGRQALHREALALAALRHERIPGLVEANTHRHADIGQAEPYLAMEYFPGPSLEKVIGPGRILGLSEALILTKRVLEAVAHCHAHGRLHRDIKPTNIILHDGDIGNPVLIDFHRAVQWPGEDTAAATPAEEGGGSSWTDEDRWADLQRDTRDDVMRVVRLLFFALTGDFRTPFRDWRMRPPHRCAPHGPALWSALRGRAGPLLQLFDCGFALDPADYFQSAAELAAALRALRASPAEAAAALRALRASPAVRQGGSPQTERTAAAARPAGAARNVAEAAPAPERIDNKLLMEFPEFQAFTSRRKPNGSDTADDAGLEHAATTAVSAVTRSTPEKLIDAACQEITDELQSSLLNRIVAASPAFFERVVLDLLIAMGYGGSKSDVAQKAARTGDGGIDGIINEDPLGLDIVYLQAKRYTPENTIGIGQVREFAGSLMERGATKGVFLTTSHFVASAKAYVDRVPQRLILIDGSELTRLMIRFGVGVRVERTIEFKRLDLDYFDEDELGST
jgi:restriction system protein